MAYLDETGVETLTSELKSYIDSTYASAPKVGSITIGSSGWTAGSPLGTPYTQTITLTGATVTSNSKVDLQASAVTVQQMIDDGTSAIFIVNNNGVLTATAIGEVPSTNLTFQWVLTELASSST